MTRAATVSAGTSVQRAQWARRHMAAAPVKADPDVIRLMTALRMNYGKAKLLKALSFGVPVTDDLALWCLGSPIFVPNVVSRLRVALGFDIEPIANTQTYIIRDQSTLTALRRIMGEA